MRRAWIALAALPLAVGACSTEGSSGPDETVSSSGSCAARLLVDGVEYVGMGGLVRDPEVTGGEVEAVLPGCDDTGGEASPDEAVTAQVLAGIDPGTALLFSGTVYLRDGQLEDEHLQRQIRHWRMAPRCATQGTFELAGTWLGVDGPHQPEYDGDIRLPYRVTMHVDTGPEAYTRAQVVVRVPESARPALGPADVEAMLWTGGSITAEVRCDGTRFVALGVRATAP